MTPNSPVRRLGLALMVLGLVGCTPIKSDALQMKDTPMNSQSKSLWALIDTLETAMPLNIARAETALGSRFAVAEEGPAYAVLKAPEVTLGDGLKVHNISLMLRPSLQFEDKSALALEIQGACITLGQLREHYAQLELFQSPRGRSVHETAVWTVTRPWGKLSFAFEQTQPDCLFRVGFHKQLN